MATEIPCLQGTNYIFNRLIFIANVGFARRVIYLSNLKSGATTLHSPTELDDDFKQVP